jgi:hypothetical protein
MISYCLLGLERKERTAERNRNSTKGQNAQFRSIELSKYGPKVHRVEQTLTTEL